jgi:ubiquinone/menaquinone biosynthesis C-methylase UbiE/predicted DNA-binding transcriptional regulator
MNTFIKILKAVAEPSRLRLLVLCSQSEFSVSELVYILGQSQPRVSRHLRVLCDVGLLQNIRDGSWVLYKITTQTEPAAIAQKILTLIPKDDPIIVKDHKRLGTVQSERRSSATDYFRFSALQWDQIRNVHIDDQKVEQVMGSILKETPINKFLDIGTGTGRILELAGVYAETLDGIDQSREMLAVARANLERAGVKHYSLHQGDMHQLQVPDDKYDVICIHQVLHFSDMPNRAISEATRVLQPGGRLIVIDFVTHGMMELREIYHHSRLGFSDGEFVHWFHQNGLNFKKPIHLSGGKLAVGVWVGIKQFKQEIP